MPVISTERWTYARMLAELPAESRYELRNYQIIEMPSPRRIHQRIVKDLTKALDDFVLKNQLGEVYVAPFDVVFDEGNTCQPDIIFLSATKSDISKEEGIIGVPDLLVEVVSKGSVVRDYVEKKNDYEKFGVQEYWIIDPLSETIIVNALENDRYIVYSSVEESGTAQSKLLAGFELTFEEVFKQNL